MAQDIKKAVISNNFSFNIWYGQIVYPKPWE